MSRILQTTLGLILGIAVFLFLGILTFAAFSDSSVGCVFGSGRSVTVTTRDWKCGMCNTADTATITAAGHTIVVAPKFLQVDGKRVAAIDADTMNIEVEAAKHEITFIGDGQTMATWRR